MTAIDVARLRDMNPVSIETYGAKNALRRNPRILAMTDYQARASLKRVFQAERSGKVEGERTFSVKEKVVMVDCPDKGKCNLKKHGFTAMEERPHFHRFVSWEEVHSDGRKHGGQSI